MTGQKQDLHCTSQLVSTPSLPTQPMKGYTSPPGSRSPYSLQAVEQLCFLLRPTRIWGAYYFTAKSGWDVESIMVSDLPVYRRIATSVTVWIQKGRICVAWVWNLEGTEKLVNGRQHSVWFVPTGMSRLPQNVLLSFWLEFPKSNPTIYLSSGISEISVKC